MAQLPETAVGLTGDDLLQQNAEVKKLYDTMRKDNPIDPLLDLTNKTQLQWCYTLADLLLKEPKLISKNTATTVGNLTALFESCRGDGTRSAIDKYPMAFYTGVCLAKSKAELRLVAETGTNIHCTVVFAMYNEIARMQPDNEDFVRAKVNQLRWLFNDFPNHSWELMGIDDGCPSDPTSGKAMQSLINAELKKRSDMYKKEGWDQVKVLFLKDVIGRIPAFSDIKTTKDSRKAGSIEYGFYQIVKKARNRGGGKRDQKAKKDVLIYTDADLSSDLGLCGSLIAGLYLPNHIKQGKVFAYADRYGEGIYDRGPVDVMCTLRAHFRGKLLPGVRTVVDTQCGFKALNVEGLLAVFDDLKCRDQSFDNEIFLGLDQKYEKVGGAEQVIQRVPIAWSESTAESTFWVFDPDEFRTDYVNAIFEMIKQCVAINEKWYKNSKRCDPKWVDYVKNLKWEDFFHMCAVLFERYQKDSRLVQIGKVDYSIEDIDTILKIEHSQKLDESQLAKK